MHCHGPRCMTSLQKTRYVTWGVGVVLGAVSFALLARLVDPYYQHAFEADAHISVGLAEAFANAWVTRSFPRIAAEIPYFDSQFWIYSFGYLLAKAASALGVLDQVRFPSNQSLSILAIRHVNLAAQVGAVVLAFLTMVRVGKSVLLAAVLALLLLLDPQLVAIDLLRIDRVILFLFVLVFALSVEIGRGRRSAVLDVLLGVAAAALAMTKITSMVFLVVPAYAYFQQRNAAAASPRHAITFLASLVVASAMINVRYLTQGWHDPSRVAKEVYDKFSYVASWKAITPTQPYLYYNWDVFLPLGALFMALFLFALVTCILAAIYRNDGEAGLVLLPLGFLSLLGIPAPKHSRTAYILMVLYLYVIACAARILRDELSTRGAQVGRAPWVVGVAAGVALLWPLSHAWHAYERARLEAVQRSESIAVTRVAPREWLIKNVRAGARVVVFADSGWANPPVHDLGYQLSYGFLNFPYLDAKAMRGFAPPAPESLSELADVVVLNNFHKSVYISIMRGFGHDRLAVEWELFFEDLVKRYPNRQFKAKSPNYSVDHVEVILINPRLPRRAG
jgi:hypothetical protein